MEPQAVVAHTERPPMAAMEALADMVQGVLVAEVRVLRPLVEPEPMAVVASLWSLR